MPLNASHVLEILKNFTIAKELRIWLQGLHLENYRGLKMIDLLCALTAPYLG